MPNPFYVPPQGAFPIQRQDSVPPHPSMENPLLQPRTPQEQSLLDSLRQKHVGMQGVQNFRRGLLDDPQIMQQVMEQANKLPAVAEQSPQRRRGALLEAILGSEPPAIPGDYRTRY